jgi:hypothetical protein
MSVNRSLPVLLCALLACAPPSSADIDAVAQGAAAEPPAGADARADALIGAWVEAAGGRGAWDAVDDVRYTITTVWYDPATGQEQRRRPREVWVRKIDGGFRVRVERTEAEGRYVQVWDGTSAWATLDGALLPDTARAVREIPMVAGDLTYWIGLPWKLYDPGVERRHFEADPHAAGPGVEVGFADGTGLHPGDRYWYYFGDASSPLPTELHFLEQDRGPEARERTLWSDWQHAGPTLYLGRRLHVDGEGRPVKALLISDVVRNGGVSDGLFRRPR